MSETSSDAPTPPASPPHRVRVPVNVHHWENISFLHWPFDPGDVGPLVPDRTTVLTANGASWVGVTPFFIRVRPAGSPVVPPGWAFPETNLRTYVAGPDGREGLCFLRMEVTARWFVATMRAVGLPYVRQRMTVHVDDDHVVYASRPRRGSSAGGHDIVVRPGEPLDPPSGGPLERFLTARWAAYHRRGPVLLYTPVDHPPWRLRTAHVDRCRVDGLFAAAGLPAPAGAPVAHYSPGVTAKVGRPRPVTGRGPVSCR